MPLFDKQIARKPNNYPRAQDFIDAIDDGHWTVRQFNFRTDYSDFQKLSPEVQGVLVRAISAISQIEVAVKTFWGKLGETLPQPIIVDLGYTMAHNECYHKDTEVMTPDGWKLIKEVSVGDDIYQYNPETSTFELSQVSHVVAYPFSGNLIQFGSKSNLCQVTPNHDMVIKSSFTGKVKKVKAEEVKLHNDNLFPKTGVVVGNDSVELTALDRVKILLQADGSRRIYQSGEASGARGGYTYAVGLKRERKITRARELFKAAGLDYKEYASSDGETIIFHLFLKENYKNFDWVDLTKVSANWCSEFIKEIQLWDGGQGKYYTKHEALANKVQLVAILGGYQTTIGCTPNKDNKGDRWRVYFHQHNVHWKGSLDLPKKSVPYTGNVYCVTVPSGVLLTRLQGKTFIAGNSIHNKAYERLLEVLGLEDIFEENLKLDVVAGRVKYLQKYNEKNYKNQQKQFVYSLILFTGFVENTSLLSQFGVISHFHRHRNILPHTAQQISYTLKEEVCHADIGTWLINTLRAEYPDLFDQELEDRIAHEMVEAYKAESKVIDWIFSGYEEPGLSADIMKAFIKRRMNDFLESISFKTMPESPEEEALLENLRWFQSEIRGVTTTDFFHKHPTEYAKSSKVYDLEDLF